MQVFLEPRNGTILPCKEFMLHCQTFDFADCISWAKKPTPTNFLARKFWCVYHQNTTTIKILLTATTILLLLVIIILTTTTTTTTTTTIIIIIIISNRDDIPKWMTLGKMVLCQKDPSKGNAVDNYRPISCLLLMWKLMTGTVAESLRFS